MRWTKQDKIDLLLGLQLGLSYIEIASILNRTHSSILHKASKLGVSNQLTEQKYVKLLPKDLELKERFIDTTTKILHKHSCGFIWKINPSKVLNGRSCPKCAGNLKKTTKQYKAALPENFKILEEYKGYDVKVLHKHLVCDFIWKVSPNSLLNNKGCPNCVKSGFQPNKPATTYLVYFYALGLYKVGITNRTVKERFSREPQPYEIILERYFENGKDAMELEKYWLSNVELYNSGELKSGNTETFVIGRVETS